MNRQLLILSMALSATAIASAQTILSTVPASQGTLPTMAQLTPGNRDYIYAKTLLNAHFDADGTFHYDLPDDAKHAEARPYHPNDDVSADGQWKVRQAGDRLWVDAVAPEGADSTAATASYQVSDADAASDSPDAGQSDIVWGQSVHRNEFGINGGTFWSPKSHLLAFYRMDQSMVGRYPLLQTNPREADVKWIRYPMAGMASHHVTVGIYNPDTQQTVWLKSPIDDPEHYYTCICWRPDEQQLYIAELNRLQNHMDLNVYDAHTGAYVETLFTEQSDKYVEPQHPLYFLPGTNDRFVWLSQRNGYCHAYLYTLGQSEPVQLTDGAWAIKQVLGFDAKGRHLYFVATKDSPLEDNLYSVNIKTRRVTRITTDAGMHRVMANKDFTQVYDTYSRHDIPRVCQLITVKDGKPVRTEVLYTAPDPYAACDAHPALARPEVEVGTLKAADGVTDLYYRLVKPRQEGAASHPTDGKYPVIVYLYNGPHAQLVTEGYQWGLPGWDCYMANQGYVVFTIDGRGSSNRGLAFEQTIWHNLGYNEAQDQLAGVAYLKTLPYVDADRIGIYGWSYGGFMTTYMKLNYPETFKVGVCGGPVLDWSRYEVMYGERYMGTPQDNPEGYKANTMIEQTGKLQGHLLIIHDDQDGTVVPQMSYQFLKNAVATGTYPDYLMYMNHEHNVRGKDRVHLLNNISRYFAEHL